MRFCYLGVVFLLIVSSFHHKAYSGLFGFGSKSNIISKEDGSTKLTYLDTLNETVGEVSLNYQSGTSSLNSSIEAIKQEDGGVDDRFRIQILAAKDKSALESELNNASKKLSYTIDINYVKPYYRLQVMGFSDRKSAEDALIKVKTAGYPDAWILSVKE